MKKKKRGQSTLEYVILIGGVVAVFLTLTQTGAFRTAVQDTIISTTNGMTEMAGRLADSRAAQ